MDVIANQNLGVLMYNEHVEGESRKQVKAMMLEAAECYMKLSFLSGAKDKNDVLKDMELSMKSVYGKMNVFKQRMEGKVYHIQEYNKKVYSEQVKHQVPLVHSKDTYANEETLRIQQRVM